MNSPTGIALPQELVNLLGTRFGWVLFPFTVISVYPDIVSQCINFASITPVFVRSEDAGIAVLGISRCFSEVPEGEQVYGYHFLCRMYTDLQRGIEEVVHIRIERFSLTDDLRPDQFDFLPVQTRETASKPIGGSFRFVNFLPVQTRETASKPTGGSFRFVNYGGKDATDVGFLATRPGGLGSPAVRQAAEQQRTQETNRHKPALPAKGRRRRRR